MEASSSLAARLVHEGHLGAYAGLTKPAGVLPHLVTAGAAMFLAAGGRPDTLTFVSTLAGGGMVAAAANTLNSYLDRDIDALMSRTHLRPLATGQIQPKRALIFGIGLGLLGAFILTLFANFMAAILAIAALAYYILPYTQWSKRRTCWSTIVGSGAGAITPLVGWAAVTNHFSPTPFLLSAIIILWTIPHFWTLALFRKEDYARAGIDVLPRTGVHTWIATCSLLLVLASLLLTLPAHLGIVYTISASALGTVLAGLALMLRNRTQLQVALFRYSILYIGILFLAMIADRLLM